MQMQSVLQWTRRKPFEPFKVVLSDGEIIEVRHPEFIMPTYSEVVVGTKFNQEGLPQHSRFVSYMHIVKIEPLEASIQPGVANA